MLQQTGKAVYIIAINRYGMLVLHVAADSISKTPVLLLTVYL